MNEDDKRAVMDMMTADHEEIQRLRRELATLALVADHNAAVAKDWESRYDACLKALNEAERKADAESAVRENRAAKLIFDLRRKIEGIAALAVLPPELRPDG